MSSISSIGSTGTSDAAAIYQEYLARLQAQKQSATTNDAKPPSAPAPAPTADVDHDGDSR